MVGTALSKSKEHKIAGKTGNYTGSQNASARDKQLQEENNRILAENQRKRREKLQKK